MTDLPPTGDDSPLGLLTDLYELRMAQTYLAAGMTAPATFTLYIRPDARRPWWLAAGTAGAIDVLDRFRYGPPEIDYLARDLGFSDAFLGWLSDLGPQGELRAVDDGTIVLGDEPLLELTAPLPYAQLLETALLCAVQFPTLIATKAARCAIVAGDAVLADFGARRAHGLAAAVEASRAASIGGVRSTSNVEAGRRFGLPVVGTMAHSFIQAYADEVAAFRVFAADHPGNVVLLVDTYDTIAGVRNAIAVGEELRERGESLDGVRLDSGDLAQLARETRSLLDDAGFDETRIFASGGIDEWEIHRLIQVERAPIDAFGVGTALTTSRDHPASDIVYKLVEYDGEPRAKYSEGKVLLPGAKQVFRDGSPDTDVLGLREETEDSEVPPPPGEPLLDVVWREGKTVRARGLEEVWERADSQLATLPDAWRHPDGPGEAPRPRVSDRLAVLRDRLRDAEVPST